MLFPAPGTATEADVIRYLEAPRKRLCELIDGVLVKKPMGMLEGVLGAWISHCLWGFVSERHLGAVFGADSPIRLRLGLVRYPDVGFISWDRIPGDELPNDAIGKIIPDLAVEVLSRSNTAGEIELKLDHYFEAGIRLAWVIDPATKTADIYTSRRRVKHLDARGVLEGGKVLPGFKMLLAELFAVPKRKKK
jgi:Uma2 family endonuclease